MKFETFQRPRPAFLLYLVEKTLSGGSGKTNFILGKR